MQPNPERERIEAAARREAHWPRWGPYLSDRQWGTVREDYRLLAHTASRVRSQVAAVGDVSAAVRSNLDMCRRHTVTASENE
jgi:hypothetical protein